MQKYQLYPSLVNFENMIDINKIFKVNILVYDKELKTFYGFCQDNIDSNVLKLFTPAIKYDENYIESSFPNFVAFTKDVAFIYKTAILNSARIGLDVLNYRGVNKDYTSRFGVKAFRTTIVEEERPCFDYQPFKNKMIDIVSEMSFIPDTNVYENIMDIDVFKEAIFAPASKGIIAIRYNKNVFFIVSNIINCKKNERVDLIVKDNKNNGTRILDFKIYKKEGILDVIYRQFLL